MLDYTGQWKTRGSPEWHTNTHGDEQADILQKEMAAQINIFIFCRILSAYMFVFSISRYCGGPVKNKETKKRETSGRDLQVAAR